MAGETAKASREELFVFPRVILKENKSLRNFGSRGELNNKRNVAREPVSKNCLDV